MNKALIAAILVIGLTGCAPSTPRLSQVELDKGNYGTLTTDEADQVIKARLARTLIDPDSLRYRGPEKMVKYWATDNDGKYHYGWLAQYGANAKNQYGGYTGEKMYAAFIENKKIIRIYEKDEYGWPPSLESHIMN